MKGRRYLKVAILAFLCSFCITGCETPNEGFHEANRIAWLITTIYRANRCGPPQNPAQEIEVNTEYVFGGSVCLAVTTSGPAEIRITSSGDQGGSIFIYDETGEVSDRVSEAEGNNLSLNLLDGREDLRFETFAGNSIDYRLEVIE